jgi:hypothetical protein
MGVLHLGWCLEIIEAFGNLDDSSIKEIKQKCSKMESLTESCFTFDRGLGIY